MVVKKALDDGALGAGAAAVDQPHLAESPRRRLFQVFVHYRRDVPRCEGVQVKAVLDGNLERTLVLGALF